MFVLACELLLLFLFLSLSPALQSQTLQQSAILVTWFFFSMVNSYL